MNKPKPPSSNSRIFNLRSLNGALSFSLGLIAILVAASPPALSQEVSEHKSNKIVIRGTVLSVEGKPVCNAKVFLKKQGANSSENTITGTKGEFSFSVTNQDTYSLTAEETSQVSDALTLPPTTLRAGVKIELVLNHAKSSTKTPDASQTSLGAMQFADQPNFTVAGVTDFTAAGGHGSDSALRTSEALAVETANLKPDSGGNSKEVGRVSSGDEERLKAAVLNSPNSFDANHRLGELYFQNSKYSEAIPLLQNAYRIDRQDRGNEYDLALACKAIGDAAHSKKYVEELLTRQETGDVFRLAAELDESLGDSLAAVREYQKAASLDPSEQNFFAWGSELLVHRAIWQAQQVFGEGAKQYPASSRMLTGLGTALFSGAAYEQAAMSLCKASDLKPNDPGPYIILGKVQMAAPNHLGCIEERLRRFVSEQPSNAAANYLYAMALQKQEDYTANPEKAQRSETLLRAAIAIDPSYSEAYLQLGIFHASQRDFMRAIDFYTKAITANPQMSDAYYRLAVAYDRTGQSAKAREEFSLHDTIAKQQATETERQRQQLKQFFVVLPPEPSHARTQ